jgi:hypothetical protein
MTQAAHKYGGLLRRYVEGLDGGSLTQEQEESILDEMDGLWWEMTEEEREAVDAPPEVGG